MELRKYICIECGHEFYVDCDADEYPNYCPYCGKEDAIGKEAKMIFTIA